MTERGTFVSEGRRRIASSDELAYGYARAIVSVVLGLMYVLGVAHPAGQTGQFLYLAAWAGFTLVGAIQAFQWWVLGVEIKRTLVYALPVDLLLIGVFTSVLGATSDLGFALALSWPVLYTLVLRRREAWMVSGFSAAMYSVGSASSVLSGARGFLELVLHAVVIVLVGGRVAYSEQRQRERQEQVEVASKENERLNAELSVSLRELRALFEITDRVHANLDFDTVASPVLNTIARALDLGECALFVVDKTNDAVLSSATLGFPLDTVLPASVDCDTRLDSGLGSVEEGLVCLCPFDEEHLRIVLCGKADDFSRIGRNDHLLLQTIGRQVAVAVDNSLLYTLTKRMAITDELTGLHNYRFLQQHIKEEVARARRYSNFVSLLMIDADDFKAFNDSYGHVAGDKVLAELGQVLSDNVRTVDLVARYGGEEFSVLLPETDMMGAFAVAEKLRDAVCTHSFQEPYDRHLSVSIGLASYPTHGIDAESVLRAADDALYGAKNSGKNQVHTPGIYDGQLV
jgi:diguanylate cyclase (GGDEF)-like protein